jgi:adenine phosphoribosyltransferase
MFRDITTLLGDAAAFTYAVDALARPHVGAAISKVVGIEARGFILGGAVAHRLGAGFAPMRKPGKLPSRTLRADYALEYGADALEVHEDAITTDERVLIVDDLIATGGTALAAVKLIRQLGGEPIAAAFVIDLPELGGMEALRAKGLAASALIAFEGR